MSSNSNLNAFDEQRQFFRLFNKYNNQFQWRFSAVKSFQQQFSSAQCTYYNKIDKNHNFTYDKVFDNDYLKQDNSYEEYKELNYDYHKSNKNLEKEIKSSIENQKLNDFFIQILNFIKNAIYKRCDKQFFLKNKLHVHLRRCNKIKSKKLRNAVITIYHKNLEIIVFDAFSKQTKDLKFCFWQYLIIKAFMTIIQKDDTIDFIKFTKCTESNIISNFDYIIWIIDWHNLIKQILNAIIKRIAQAIKI